MFTNPTHGTDNLRIDDLYNRVTIQEELLIQEANDGAILIALYDSADDGIIDVRAAGTTTIHLDGNDDSYFTNKVGLGTTAIPAGEGYARFAIHGSPSNSNGPHIQYSTTADDYPLFQQLNWTHDNISMFFDGYYDGAWRSSSNTSMYALKPSGKVDSYKNFEAS